MQTFLPYKDFARSASVLDDRRLGKQRVECLQILKALSNPNYGWQNHPAVKMWIGYRIALAHYGQVICEEWCKRGFKDTCADKIQDFFALAISEGEAGNDPPFIGNEAFHLSHQSNLIRKAPDFYRPIFGPSVPYNLPYIWPLNT